LRNQKKKPNQNRTGLVFHKAVTKGKGLGVVVDDPKKHPSNIGGKKRSSSVERGGRRGWVKCGANLGGT